MAALSDLPEMVRKFAEKLKDISEEDIEKVLKALPEGDEDPYLSIREFHQDFTDLLAETNIETLVVFIDDLDRCMPDTVVSTLEAIKLFLFAPQTVFIIGADEQLVRHAVRQRFPELRGGEAEIGRDYLEKLIQFPVRIPPLGHVELETYVNLLFVERERIEGSRLAQLRKVAVDRSPAHLYDVTFSLEAVEEVVGEVSSELREGIALAGYLAPVLTSGLSGNPRQTKRFLNTLMMRKIMADSREVKLELRVLAKLMLLEYFRPESFQQLARLQVEQGGQPLELALMERAASLSSEALEVVTPSHKDATAADSSSAVNTGSGDETATGEGESGNEAPSDDMDLEAILDDSLMSWLSDSWIKDWLVSEPQLASHDLRPYFFFSRDRLEAFVGTARRLSPVAREILAKITSQSDVHRRQAARRASTVSEAEAAAVFSALAERAKQQEDLSDDRSVLSSIFDLVEVRPELAGQLVTVLEQLAETALSAAHVPRFEGVTKDSEAYKAALNLQKRWSESTTNSSLAAAAKSRLERISKSRETSR